MESYASQLSEPARLRARSLGADGKKWMAALDATVATLAQRWRLEPGGVLSGGSESLVVAVRDSEGKGAILKIGMTGSADLAAEARIYALAEGRGYAELYATDNEHNALLLERLGKPLEELEPDHEKQMEIICACFNRTWRDLEEPGDLMTGAEKAQWLANFISERWSLLDEPCPQSVVKRALSFAAERIAAFNPRTAVLVHGDAHGLNTLRARSGETNIPMGDTHAPGWKFIDPDGMFAERACDLATLMRDWSAPLLQEDTVAALRRRGERLAELTGVDSESIWQWGYMERVSTGLVLHEIGMHEEGREMLEVATAVVDVRP